jgi:Peptidase A4 family
LAENKIHRTRIILLLIVWILILALTLGVLSLLQAYFDGNPQSSTVSSLSWAGYIVARNSNESQQIIGINASWVVPQVNASAGDGFSSAWIGIGGQLDKTLIQIGTEHDVIKGQKTYNAWYELLPNFAVILTELTISPGDSMVASINLIDSATNNWNIQINDVTTGQDFNRNVNYNSTRSSVEWILERPTINNKISPLNDFGNLTFTNCCANINSLSGPLSKFSFSQIQMANSQNIKLTATSTLTADGSSFTITYIASE